MAEVKHRAFNPNTVGTGYSPLGSLCEYEEKLGFQLVQVIPHHTYEAIAVFERADEPPDYVPTRPCPMCGAKPGENCKGPNDA